jgi:hypothetical protein
MELIFDDIEAGWHLLIGFDLEVLSVNSLLPNVS